MNKILVAIMLFLLVPLYGYSQGDNRSLKDELSGEWTIDLRPTPESDGYFQPFVIESIEENTFEGTFYGSKIENALLNYNWDRPYFAFTTRDLNSEYYHSGYLLDGKLHGISYCPDRNFTAPWSGVKK